MTISQPINVAQLVDALTDAQFEQVVRMYVDREASRFPNNKFPGTLLLCRSTDGTTSWTICEGYGDKDVGKVVGELLNMCVSEHLRRQLAKQANKLMMIESSVSEVNEVSEEEAKFNDEIPF